MATLTSARDAEDVLRSFLRYQAPRLVAAGAVQNGGVDDDDAAVSDQGTSSVGGKTGSIPVARLAAAKDAAREAFLAAHASRPTQAAAAATTTGAAAATTTTPPSSATSTAAARTAPNRGKTTGNTRKDPAHRLPTPPSGKNKAGTTRGARLGTTAPSPEAVLQSVMVNVHSAAPLLDAMFPPAAVSSSDSPVTTTATTASSSSSSAGQREAQWVCYVSTQPATREDVVAMHAQLRQRLQDRRARATGLCPVRREIYEDVFDELLRQVAIEEPARGVLLQRLRDELHDTVRVHQDLCNRSQHLCSTRLLQAHDDEALAQMEVRIKAIEQERNDLRAVHHALSVRRAAIEARQEKERAARNKKQQEELAYLRRANQQLSLRLKLETERVTAGVNNSRLNGLAAALQE